nr:SMR family transporter [Acidaminococcus massiliensis]
MKMAWCYLFVAGAFECIWSACMKLSEGFTRLGYTLATLAGLVVSFGALVLATKKLPPVPGLPHLDRHRSRGFRTDRGIPVP